MSAYNYKAPKECDVGVSRQLEIALINAQKGETNERLDYTSFDSFTYDNDVYEFKCSLDNTECSVNPNHLIKSKIIERLDAYCFVEPTCLAHCMKSSFDSIPFDAAVKLYEALKKAEENLMIIIQFKFMIQ